LGADKRRDTVESLSLCELFCSQIVSEVPVDVCILSAQSPAIVAPNFPKSVLLGNLQHLFWWDLWESLRSQAGLEPLLGEEDWLPLSYRPVPPKFLESIEISARRGKLSRSRYRWKRSLEHYQVLEFLFSELLHLDAGNSWIEFKRHFRMVFRDQDRLQASEMEELFCDQEGMLLLKKVSHRLWGKRPLLKGPPLFTRQSLDEMGISFPMGCIYEGNGYDLSWWYLPDVDLGIVIRCKGEFSHHFFVLIELLAELEYFESFPSKALKSLEEQCRTYPWLNLELRTGERA